MIAGLLGKGAPLRFEIREFPGKGRGVVLDAFEEGAYLVEYEAEVYPRKEMAARLVEYRVNEEGCYVIEVLTKDGWLCLDATRCDDVYEYVSCIVQQIW